MTTAQQQKWSATVEIVTTTFRIERQWNETYIVGLKKYLIKQ